MAYNRMTGQSAEDEWNAIGRSVLNANRLDPAEKTGSPAKVVSLERVPALQHEACEAAGQAVDQLVKRLHELGLLYPEPDEMALEKERQTEPPTRQPITGDLLRVTSRIAALGDRLQRIVARL